MNYRSLLVTGGAGFVGSNLAIKYKQRHPESRVCAFDNLKRRGSALNIPLLQQFSIKFIHGDIRNQEEFPGFEVDLILDCSA